MELERPTTGPKQGHTMTALTESVVEDAALAWLGALGYTVLHGAAIAQGEPGAERTTRTTAMCCWSGGSATPSPS